MAQHMLDGLAIPTMLQAADIVSRFVVSLALFPRAVEAAIRTLALVESPSWPLWRRELSARMSMTALLSGDMSLSGIVGTPIGIQR